MSKRDQKPDPKDDRLSEHGSRGDRNKTHNTVERIRERADRIEDMFVKGYRIGQVRAELAKEGLRPRTIRRWVAYVHARWAKESRLYDREGKRNRMRETLWHGARVALEKQKPVVIYQGKDVPSIVKLYPDPDVKGAKELLELISRLDGLLDQPDRSDVAVIPERIIVEIRKAYGIDKIIDATPAKLATGE